MSLGRRKIRVDDPASWVFNRMVDAYQARPAYPAALIDDIAELAGTEGGSIGDLGAGIGHLALPLAARGFDVVAIEPAAAMLERLRVAALDRALTLRSVHAAAEALPLETGCLNLVAVVDALHFLDRQLAAHEIRRVLAPHGTLALVTCEFADTPFMRAVVEIMEAAAPRRPREVDQSVAQVSAITKIRLDQQRRFHDETMVDRATLDRILCSISFIGPAMKPERFAAFRERVHALPIAPVWARTFTLRSGKRGPSSRVRIETARRAGVAQPR